MLKIAALSGSLRKRSYNTALARAALAELPGGFQGELLTIAGIPVYNGDLESMEGLPTAVTALKQTLAASSGLLLATPEYNNSMPGPLKNAIDWLSRPSSDTGKVLDGLPVGLLGATPGRGGTRLSQAAWLQVLRALGMRPFFGKRLEVSGAGDLFDDDLKLTDEETRKRVGAFVTAFAAFVKESARRTG